VSRDGLHISGYDGFISTKLGYRFIIIAACIWLSCLMFNYIFQYEADVVFKLVLAPLSLLVILVLVYHFPVLSLIFFGMDLGGLLIGPAHIYQHNNDN